eukprot:gene33209-31983_t
MWARLRGCVGGADDASAAATGACGEVRLTQRDSAPPRPARRKKYRFAVGDRVSARCADEGWHAGTVVAEDWREPWRPARSKAA